MAFKMSDASRTTLEHKTPESNKSDYPFPVLPAAISQRVAFAESAALGQSVLKGEPSGAAAHESIALTRAAVEMMPHAEKNRTRDRHTTIG
jgi:cellulose biosynthesis protein BcsQ